jgi:hypothetical protein
MQPATSYAVTSAAAGVYALAFMLLLVASVGDTTQRFNVQAWFSWQAVMLVVLVADSRFVVALSRTARRWHAFARQALLAAAAGQSIGFLIWVAVTWSNASGGSDDGPLIDQPDNVYAILIAALATQFVVALAAFFAVLRNDFAWWE